MILNSMGCALLVAAAGVTDCNGMPPCPERDAIPPKVKVQAAPRNEPGGPYSPLGATLHVAGHEFPIRDRELPVAKAAGIGTVRGGIYLQQVLKPDGTFDFSRPDAALASCEKAGVEWLPILFATKMTPPVREDLPRWRRYVRALAARYRGRIRTWEVWNEQNIRSFWYAEPNATNYVKVLRAAWEEVKAADPAARVALGGIAGVPADYVEELYRCGARDFFDIMNVHPYVYPDGPEGNLDTRMDTLKKIMRKYGDANKPIWFTEIGWHTAKWKVRSTDVLVRGLKRIDPKKKDWKIVYTDGEVHGAWSALVKPILPQATLEEVPMSRFPAWLAEHRPDVVVFPHGGRYDQTALAAVERHLLPRGGILACLSGVPFFTSCTSDAAGNIHQDAKNAGFATRPRLGIRMASEHTDRRIPKSVRLENGREAQRFFSDSFKPGVTFEPLEGYSASTNGLSLVAAGIYRYEYGRNGTILVSGMMEPSTRACSEAGQARVLPRAIAHAMRLGAERYFIYEFQAMETDDFDGESHFGIVHRDLSPKPAYEALKAFHTFRPDGSRAAQGLAPAVSPGGTHACQWMRPDGTLAGMLWNVSDPGERRLKFLTGNVRFHSSDGRPLDAECDGNGFATLTLGPDAVYYAGGEFTGACKPLEKSCRAACKSP